MSRGSSCAQYLHPALKIGYGPRRLCGQIPDVPAFWKGMLMRRLSYVASCFYGPSYNSVQIEPRDRIVRDTLTTHDHCSLFYFRRIFLTQKIRNDQHQASWQLLWLTCSAVPWWDGQAIQAFSWPSDVIYLRGWHCSWLCVHWQRALCDRTEARATHLRAFGTVNPGVDANPISAQSSTLAYWKRQSHSFIQIG